MKVYIGSDHAAFNEKLALIEFLSANGDFEVVDVGPFSNERCDYPVYAEKVARFVGAADLAGNSLVRGILLCGSGIGVSMVANRFQGVRAALCRTTQEAKLAREHNNANILCMGARLLSQNELNQTSDVFFKASFEGGRHTQRLSLFNEWGERP